MSDLKPEQTVGEEEVDVDIDDVSIVSENDLSEVEELDEDDNGDDDDDDDSIESGIHTAADIEGYDADLQNIDDNGLDEEGKIELLNDGETEYDDDNSDDDFEHELKKMENIEKQSYIDNYHQTLVDHNEEEIKALSVVIRDKNNNIIDNLHKLLPILTKYEKSRILGIRASQINNGAQILVKQKIKTFDGYLIAQQELEERKIPFIIKRPLPMGGGCEYWKLDDLEIV
jgi:DNA-directed RNA polymerase I, II, and III subunit RPABC2